MSSWSTSWAGTATDFTPELLAVSGKPGRIAAVAADAIWESVQRIGEQDVHARVKLEADGYEDRENPGIGRFSLEISVEPEPTEIQSKLENQQPVDLLRSGTSAGTQTQQTPTTSE